MFREPPALSLFFSTQLTGRRRHGTFCESGLGLGGTGGTRGGHGRGSCSVRRGAAILGHQPPLTSQNRPTLKNDPTFCVPFCGGAKKEQNGTGNSVKRLDITLETLPHCPGVGAVYFLADEGNPQVPLVKPTFTHFQIGSS